MDIAITADTGIVNIYAHKILLATPHLTADNLFVIPAPIMHLLEVVREKNKKLSKDQKKIEDILLSKTK